MKGVVCTETTPSVWWPIYIINSVDTTKFLYTTSPQTQHHSFLRNYPLHSSVMVLVLFLTYQISCGIHYLILSVPLSLLVLN